MTDPHYDKEYIRLTRRQTIRAAKDLLYPQEVIDALEEAKTIGEMGRIMVTQRQKGVN